MADRLSSGRSPGALAAVLVLAPGALTLGVRWAREYQRLRARTRELAALHSLVTPPVSSDLAGVVQHITDVVGVTFRADAHVELNGRGAADGTAEAAPQAAPKDDHTSFAHPVRPSESFREPGRRRISIPLVSEQRLLGIMSVERGHGSAFTLQERHLLDVFGAEAAALLERSHRYEGVAAAAVLQERSRLAREIHDGLAQHLAFLKMRVAWLQRSTGPVENNSLQDIETVLETALAEARQAISTLRAEPSGTSTAEAICEYARQFAQLSDLRVSIDADDNVPEVAPRARVELLRVVQEALNNVRKHAHSTAVQIQIQRWADSLVVCVQDDGSGFPPGQERGGHFGLDIMTERAESIGGSLEVTSSPGTGTVVCIRVPLQFAARAMPRNGTD